MNTNWGANVHAAVRKAKIEVVGQYDIKNEAQAVAVIGVLAAWGNSASGFVYVEPSRSTSSTRPPDVLLCHPDVGLLVIEVKGHPIDRIEGTKAGSLMMKSDGFLKPMNPIRQAEDCMYEIKNDVERKLRAEGIRAPRLMPLFNVMVAFPNISASDWAARGFDATMPEDLLLFREHLESASRLRKRVGQVIDSVMRQTHREAPLTVNHIQVIKAVFGDSAVVNHKRPPRTYIDEFKLGHYIDEMASLDKYLSHEQQELSRLNLDGYPRLIRGVAGSGKTIVLANLVARFINRRLNYQPALFDEENTHDDLRVGVVCFNRSLVPFIQQKIRDAYQQQTMQSVPTSVLDVTHFNGFVYQLGQEQVLEYIKIGDEPDSAQRAVQYLAQLEAFERNNPEWFKSIQFDAIFVDEGQDLSLEEFQLMLKLVRTHPHTGEKTLIIFYDDAQNLYARTRPNWSQVGVDVARGDRSRVMKECFRNPREVVELAFNVLLGSLAPEEIRVKTRTYSDVNYLKRLKLVEELGDHFRVRFAERTFKKPFIKCFPSRDEEKAWVSKEIVELIEHDYVRPEDILVLFHKSTDFLDLPDLIAEQVRQESIQGYIQPFGKHDADKNHYIFRERYLTLSTTHGAKGYDAYVVFLIGADLFYTDERDRASFYVGATRTKLVLYVTGLASNNGHLNLIEEAQAVNQVL